MPGLFDGTPLERPVTCGRCEQALAACRCPRDAEGRPARGREQRVRVQRERRGGKFVTVIFGLDLAEGELAALLKQFRTSLGAGGTVKDGALELQGDHRDALVERLKALGYAAKAAGG